MGGTCSKHEEYDKYTYIRYRSWETCKIEVPREMYQVLCVSEVHHLPA